MTTTNATVNTLPTGPVTERITDTTTITLIPLENCYSDDNVNSRKGGIGGSYNIPLIREQLIAKGKITDPLTVEYMGNGRFLVEKGNRRFRGCLDIVNDPNLTDAQKAPFRFLPCFVLSGLTEVERTAVVFDHGGVVSLTREETVLNVWRLAAQLKTAKEIANIMFTQLAQLGDSKKLNHIPADKDEREKYLAKWFRGTLDQWILYGCAMGAYIREQFLLTVRRMDGNIPEKFDGWTLNCTRPRISALYAAKTFDSGSKGTGWTVKDGGETFNALILQYQNEDAGKADKNDEPKRLKDSVVRERADHMKSDAMRSALRATLGDASAGVGLPNVDEWIARLEVVRDTVAKVYSRISDPRIAELLSAVILADGSVPAGSVDVALAPFLTADADAPVAPTEPVAPVAPTEPVATEPETPVAPVAPTEPVVPVATTEPVATEPETPVAPPARRKGSKSQAS